MLNCKKHICCFQEAVQHAFGMIEVTQPHEQRHADAGVGTAYVPDISPSVPHISQPFVDISPDVSDRFHMGEPPSGMRPLMPVNEDGLLLDAAAFGSDGFQPYGSPSRVRMLHFRIEYRQKNVPIILQDINCVGECVVVVKE